ncbi:MAG: tyrosine-type recombinase/integrase [Alphaproteobacteria bacterium]|jgi:integrase|nr:tyrosine-type recombinase/integrase [Alphaproteobacteria bacterium]
MRGRSVYLQKSTGRWRIDFYHQGRRVHSYAKNLDGSLSRTRGEAEQAAFRLREALVNPGSFGATSNSAIETSVPQVSVAPMHQHASAANSYTLGEAVLSYAAASSGLRSWPSIQGYLSTINLFFGQEFLVNDLDEVKLAEFREWLQSAPILNYRGGPTTPQKSKRPEDQLYSVRTAKESDVDAKSAATPQRSETTVRKYLKALRSVLLMAHRKIDPNDPLGRPHLRAMPAFKNLRDPQGTPRPFPAERLSDVLAHLPAHAQAVVLGAVFTGWRRGQVCASQVSWLDDERQALRHDSHNKGKREGWTPLSPEGYVFFCALREQAQAIGSKHFINYREPKSGRWRSIKTIERSWLRALEAVGLAGQFRFHDLKAMVLSKMAAARVDPRTLQSIGQHADIETTMRHYIFTQFDAARDAQTLVSKELADAGLDLNFAVKKATEEAKSQEIKPAKSHTKSHKPSAARVVVKPSKLSKSLKVMARPARLERATFSFGG